MSSDKPIIILTLNGVLIKEDTTKNAMAIFFDEFAKKYDDASIRDYLLEDNLFNAVMTVIKNNNPSIEDDQLMKLTGENYINYLTNYIKKNLLDSVRSEVRDYLISIKDRFRFVLLATTPKESINSILNAAGLEKLFDIIEYSPREFMYEKNKFYSSFIEKNGLPVLYLGGDKKSSFEFYKSIGVKTYFVNFDNIYEVENVDSIYDIDELKQVIEII